MNTKLICAFIVVSVYLGASEAVTCYNCNSLTDDGCGDPFDSSKIKDTDSCSGKCSKSKVSDGAVTRGCSLVCVDIGDVTSCCEGDKCNGAATLPVSLGALLLPLLVAVYGYFKV